MDTLAGFAITFLAGCMMGSNLVPLKRIRVWKWENFWFVYSIVSLLVVPFGLAFFLLPHLMTVYASVPFSAITKPFFYGLMWGLAQLGAGICVDKIGLALTGSILNGLCAAFGTLVPLVAQHADQLSKPSGQLLLGGIVVMLLGVALCGWAGLQREKAQSHGAVEAGSRGSYWIVMLIAIVSGFLAALLNIALAFGGAIIQHARAEGAPAAWAVFSVWPIALLGGLVVNLAYSAYLLFRHNSWGRFNERPSEAGYAIVGGSLWMMAIAIYSSGTVFLGTLGLSVGWALFSITLILTGNLAGFLTGEWKASGPRIFNINVAGVAVLLIATVMMGRANYLAH